MADDEPAIAGPTLLAGSFGTRISIVAVAVALCVPEIGALGAVTAGVVLPPPPPQAAKHTVAMNGKKPIVFRTWPFLCKDLDWALNREHPGANDPLEASDAQRANIGACATRYPALL
jgi:hypothetical protein